MGNFYFGTGTFHITASSTPGTGNSYYTSGWIGHKPNSYITGTGLTYLPTMGHLQMMYGVPWNKDGGYDSGEGSGNYWITVETMDSVVLYQSPAVASGDTFASFPDIWYGPYSKIVVHADTGGTTVTLGGVIMDV
jgi:hypothetical protein